MDLGGLLKGAHARQWAPGIGQLLERIEEGCTVRLIHERGVLRSRAGGAQAQWGSQGIMHRVVRWQTRRKHLILACRGLACTSHTGMQGAGMRQALMHKHGAAQGISTGHQCSTWHRWMASVQDAWHQCIWHQCRAHDISAGTSFPSHKVALVSPSSSSTHSWHESIRAQLGEHGGSILVFVGNFVTFVFAILWECRGTRTST